MADIPGVTGGFWVIDRIDGNGRVVLESEKREIREVELSKLPPGAREGDALRWTDGPEGGVYALDKAATEQLRERARALRDSLPRGPTGPVSL